MKNIIIATLVILPACASFAQNPQRPVPPMQRPRLPAAADQAQNLKAELKAKLDVEPACEPSEDLNVEEFQLKRNDLKGRVVELTFDKVVSLKQTGAEGYVAMVTYESPRMAEGLNIVVPKDGLEFFEEQSKIDYRRKETIYVEVINPSIVRAVGTRFSKNKEPGERYSW
jgi:hypothetical protein